MKKRFKSKQYNDEVRNKVAKIRLNETEFNEFDIASREVGLEKTVIIREAVKEYLAQHNIHIWEK